MADSMVDLLVQYQKAACDLRTRLDELETQVRTTCGYEYTQACKRRQVLADELLDIDFAIRGIVRSIVWTQKG